MIWQIILFESDRGDKPVEELIKSLDQITIAKTAHQIELLEKYGSYLGMPHARKLIPDLYELRIRGKEEIRIVYAFIKRNIYLLHAFKKKTQKIPAKEIETAKKRFDFLTII